MLMAILAIGGAVPATAQVERVAVKTVRLDCGLCAVFSEIYLVDIWMGSSKVAEFYKMLANNNAAKMTYVYTSFGANNEAARDYIAGKLGVTHSTMVQGGVHEAGMHVHMRTNTTALSGI